MCSSDLARARTFGFLHEVDQLRAANLGVNSATIGLLVRTAFAGVEATKFQEADGTQQDVLLRFAPESRRDLARVGDLPIPTASGALCRKPSQHRP